MVDDQAFKERVLEQGWGPGALIPWRGDLAHQIATAGLRSCDLRADAGGPVQDETPPDGQFLLVSQLCDLTAPAASEPFAVALPAGAWDPEPDRPLPRRNSARWLVLDADARLVASQARMITFDKQRLPDLEPLHVPLNPQLISTWCARRWRRTPLPDAFTRTIQPALEDALERVDHATALSATICWRTQFLLPGADGVRGVSLIAVFDPDLIESVEFSGYVAAVTEQVDRLRARYEQRFAKQVTGFQPYQLMPSQPASTTQFSLQMALDTEMISFDHLSPDLGGEAADGPERPELREEDVV
ncbi:hypothetical protein [Miltoncostaea oceani]|uniref:hypothetical protein n=1 Tax=Miltoncostaea oceani TaxID=2843216 RepID=UPI001C3E1909|nr:hypothetical protein [Miltoncostaea oceani]